MHAARRRRGPLAFGWGRGEWQSTRPSLFGRRRDKLRHDLGCGPPRTLTQVCCPRVGNTTHRHICRCTMGTVHTSSPKVCFSGTMIASRPVSAAGASPGAPPAGDAPLAEVPSRGIAAVSFSVSRRLCSTAAASPAREKLLMLLAPLLHGQALKMQGSHARHHDFKGRAEPGILERISRLLWYPSIHERTLERLSRCVARSWLSCASSSIARSNWARGVECQ